MSLRHTVDDVGEVGFRIEAVELGGFEHAVDDGGAPAAGFGAEQQVILPRDGNPAVILPISGRKLKSFIVGTRFMDGGSDANTVNVAQMARSFTLRQLPVWSSPSWHGCSIRLLALVWSLAPRGFR